MPFLEIPELPGPVAVELDPKATVLIAVGMGAIPCLRRPTCVAMVPRVRSLIDRARAAGVRVAFGLGRSESDLLPEMGRRPDEALVRTSADKYFRTDLEETVKGLTHAIVLGTAANGAVLYTAFATCTRGFTVVVPQDCLSADTELLEWITRFQLLHQPGYVNDKNVPLEPNTATLSRSDLIRFTAA